MSKFKKRTPTKKTEKIEISKKEQKIPIDHIQSQVLTTHSLPQIRYDLAKFPFNDQEQAQLPFNDPYNVQELPKSPFNDQGLRNQTTSSGRGLSGPFNNIMAPLPHDTALTASNIDQEQAQLPFNDPYNVQELPKSPFNDQDERRIHSARSPALSRRVQRVPQLS